VSIRRGLAAVKSHVLLNSETVVPLPGKAAKEKVVTEKALQLLDTTSGFINNFMFANYDRLREVTDGNKSQRAALFTSLCGIDVVEKIDRYLREAINADKARVGEFTPAELDEATLNWSTLKLHCQGARDEVKVSRAEMPTEEEANEMREEVQFLTELQATQKASRETRSKAKERVRKYETQLKELQTELSYVEQRSKTITACVKVAEHTYQQLHAQMQEFKEWSEKKSTLYRLAKELKEKKEMEPVKPEVSKEVLMSVQDARECLSTQQTIISSVSRKLDLLNKGLFVCPTCDQPIGTGDNDKASLEAKLAAANDSAEECKQHLEKQAKRVEVLKNYEHALELFNVTVKAAEDKWEEASKGFDEKSLANPPSDVSFDLKAAKGRLDKFKKLEVSYANFESKAFSAVSNKSHSIKTSEEAIAECDKTLAEFKGVTARELNSAKAKVGVLNQKQSALDCAKSALDAYMSSVPAVSGQLRKLKAKRRKVKTIQKWLSVAQRGRDVCHRDRLPASVVAGMLHTTTAQVNAYLRSLGVPFQVSVDAEEFAFEVTHQDGSTEPAKRLSTGQSLCLGIAFWLARASVFAGQLPFFCLDEPTANLDEERLLNVADVIGKLSTEMESNGRQGVVVTHHASIARRSTNIITLK
jgi:DNA repair exonuclease SbcCD ATPase subunit